MPAVVCQLQIQQRRLEVSATSREFDRKLSGQVDHCARLNPRNGHGIRQEFHGWVIRRECHSDVCKRLRARIVDTHGKADFPSRRQAQPVATCQRQQQRRIAARSWAHETDLVALTVKRQFDPAVRIGRHAADLCAASGPTQVEQFVNPARSINWSGRQANGGALHRRAVRRPTARGHTQAALVHALEVHHAGAARGHVRPISPDFESPIRARITPGFGHIIERRIRERPAVKIERFGD